MTGATETMWKRSDAGSRCATESVTQISRTPAALMAGALIVRAVRRTPRLRKFGASHLVLARDPAFVGGVLDGEGISRRVEITADMAGLDYDAVFVIPVLPEGTARWNADT